LADGSGDLLEGNYKRACKLPRLMHHCPRRPRLAARFAPRSQGLRSL